MPVANGDYVSGTLLRIMKKNYALTALKCLPIEDALDEFYHYLHSRKFVSGIDHAILTWLKRVKKMSYFLFLLRYTCSENFACPSENFTGIRKHPC